MNRGPELGTRIGPYLLAGRLGMGGVGLVYRAERGRTAVALKTLAIASAAARQSLEREVAALSRLAHPGVVRVVDHDLDAQTPWYAMELVPGETLAERAARYITPGNPVGSASLAEALRPVCGLCDALAYVHAKGVLHRDLKPDNVIVRPSGAAVLVDFGLTQRWGGRDGREVLDPAAGGSGAYMPPEQWLGEGLDPRSDLFALGATIYALLTRAAPYPSLACLRDPDYRPRPPSGATPGITVGLDDLVLRLLARRAEDRPGHASAVGAALAGILGEPHHPSPWRPGIYRPGLVGRGDVVEGVVASARRLQDARRAGLLLVSGESGIGKTRVAQQVAHRLRRLGAVVLPAECSPEARDAPLACLRPALRAVGDGLRDQGPEAVRRTLLGRSRGLALFEPSLASLPGLEADGAAPSLPPEAARARLLEWVVSLLGAAGRPVLLLDDLHWADDLTLEVLVHALRSETPLVAIGFYRSEEAPDGLRALAAKASDRFALGRLDPGAVRELARHCLGIGSVPDRFAAELADHSEGNPFFVTELLKAAAEDGTLAFRDGRWWIPDESPGIVDTLPRSLRDLVSRRLAGLRAGARRLLDAAAVAGREADGDLLRTVAAGPRPLAAIDELLRRGILEEPRPDSYRFAHDKLREVARDRVDPARAKVLHRRVARLLEGRGAETDPGEVAAHWLGAGVRGRAREWLLRAARGAVERFAHPEAERLLRAMLDLGPTAAQEQAARLSLARDILELCGRLDEATAEFLRVAQLSRRRRDRDGILESLRGLGRNARVAGRMVEAGRLYRSALDLLGQGDPARGPLLAEIGTLEQELGNAPEALARYEEALAIHRRTGSLGGEASVLANVATLCLARSEGDRAVSLYEQALDLHRRAGDRPGEGIVLGNLANAAQAAGRIDEARELHAQAARVHAEVGNRRFQAIGLGNQSSLEAMQGRLPEAAARIAEAIAIFRQIGARRNEGMALGIQANVLRAQGRLDEARVAYEEAMARHREVADVRYEGITAGNLGRLLLDLGELEEARRVLDAALVIDRDAKIRRSEGFVVHNLAEVAECEGDEERAAEGYRSALAIHRESGNRQSEGITLGFLGDHARRQGRPDEAAPLYRQALALLHALGDRVDAVPPTAGLALLALDAGDAGDAARLIGEAEALLDPAERGVARARILEARALLDRACGRPASAAAIEGIARQLGAGPRSPIGRIASRVGERLAETH